ncbi:hypothetical protein BSR19_11560 (plasmid) [Streptococcus salivarius]|uniref:Type I restriction modification DNA specificity domain-containing protein n=1 Tax=Streptococcus salivarius TaxID=1304 RepID=A0AB37DDH0_STRSL|nr:restriction endonuclease subunit S [Streptococcus salivarius]QGU81754.1 hypothetical protein BSR19_11560 [Streptococcus salivarius]
MTNSKYVPKRRFKEFELDGEWEQDLLGNIADFSIKTNSFSREKLTHESYEVQNIHYGDILIKFQSVIDLKRDNLPSIIDSSVLDFRQSLLQDGDVIFADAAEDSTVGKAIEIRNIMGKNVVSGLHTIAARPIQLFAPYYLGYYLNSDFYHKQILPLMQGTKVSSISKSNLQVTEISFPIIDEQKKIGKFFQTIDSLITLHQHKLDKLKNLKKAYLAELFPAEGERVPKRRFSGFEGEWEEVLLGRLGNAQSGIGFPDSEQGGKVGIPFYKVSDMNNQGNEHEMVFANNYVTIEQINQRSWKPIQDVPAIFFAKVGAAVLLNRKRLCSIPFLMDNNTMAFSIDTSKIDTNFAKTIFETIDLPSLIQVGALPSYNARDVESILVSVPSLPEQEKIGEFFQKLDKSISIQQQKLDKLNDLKKAYLNELFV